MPSFEAARLHGTSQLRTIPDGWRVLKTIWREWAAPRVARAAPEAVRLGLREAAVAGAARRAS